MQKENYVAGSSMEGHFPRKHPLSQEGGEALFCLGEGSTPSLAAPLRLRAGGSD